jgi:hypothetical protein
MKMKNYSENEKTLVQNQQCEMFLSEAKCENEVMKETQTQVCKLKKVEFQKIMKKSKAKFGIIAFPKEKVESS